MNEKVHTTTYFVISFINESTSFLKKQHSPKAYLSYNKYVSCLLGLFHKRTTATFEGYLGLSTLIVGYVEKQVVQCKL